MCPVRPYPFLFIIKLPFDVPSDPVIASRAETFENAFSEYTLPEAILRFRQGFGRLIRTQSDRGIVAVLDRRGALQAIWKIVPAIFTRLPSGREFNRRFTG